MISPAPLPLQLTGLGAATWSHTQKEDVTVSSKECPHGPPEEHSTRPLERQGECGAEQGAQMPSQATDGRGTLQRPTQWSLRTGSGLRAPAMLIHRCPWLSLPPKAQNLPDVGWVVSSTHSLLPALNTPLLTAVQPAPAEGLAWPGPCTPYPLSLTLPSGTAHENQCVFLNMPQTAVREIKGSMAMQNGSRPCSRPHSWSSWPLT